MRRGTKFKAAVVLFLLVILIGSSVAVSVTVAEILSVVAIVIVLAVVIFSIIGSRRDRKRKTRARMLGAHTSTRRAREGRSP